MPRDTIGSKSVYIQRLCKEPQRVSAGTLSSDSASIGTHINVRRRGATFDGGGGGGGAIFY